jgi:hypothetical protein
LIKLKAFTLSRLNFRNFRRPGTEQMGTNQNITLVAITTTANHQIYHFNNNVQTQEEDIIF